MVDPIYAGIKINTNKVDGLLLHAMNSIYNAANNMFALLTNMDEEVRKELFAKAKVPEAYTMQVISEQKDIAYNFMHYQLLSPFINDLSAGQKEYIGGMKVFFTDMYSSMFNKRTFDDEQRIRVESAYKKLETAREKSDVIFNETLMGPNSFNPAMVNFLKSQLDQILNARKLMSKVVDKKEWQKKDDGKSTDTES